jgi:transposase
MPRSRPAYPPEFRQKLIELVHAGRSPEDLAREFEPTAQTIRNWIAQAEANGGKRHDVLTSLEREELGRRLLEHLKPGSRIVSHAFDMGDWPPAQTFTVNGSQVYRWTVPAHVL